MYLYYCISSFAYLKIQRENTGGFSARLCRYLVITLYDYNESYARARFQNLLRLELLCTSLLRRILPVVKSTQRISISKFCAFRVISSHNHSRENLKRTQLKNPIL